MDKKQKLIEEIILVVKQEIANNATIDFDDTVSFDGNDFDHIAEQVAEELYNAGYRKTFTSSLASGTQAAYKEGYAKGYEEAEDIRKKTLDEVYAVLWSIKMASGGLKARVLGSVLDLYNPERSPYRTIIEEVMEKAITETAQDIIFFLEKDGYGGVDYLQVFDTDIKELKERYGVEVE